MRAPHAPHRVRKLIIGEPRTVPRDKVRRHDEFERVQPRAHDGAELGGCDRAVAVWGTRPR